MRRVLLLLGLVMSSVAVTVPQVVAADGTDSSGTHSYTTRCADGVLYFTNTSDPGSTGDGVLEVRAEGATLTLSPGEEDTFGALPSETSWEIEFFDLGEAYVFDGGTFEACAGGLTEDVWRVDNFTAQCINPSALAWEVSWSTDWLQEGQYAVVEEIVDSSGTPYFSGQSSDSPTGTKSGSFAVPEGPSELTVTVAWFVPDFPTEPLARITTDSVPYQCSGPVREQYEVSVQLDCAFGAWFVNRGTENVVVTAQGDSQTIPPFDSGEIGSEGWGVEWETVPWMPGGQVPSPLEWSAADLDGNVFDSGAASYPCNPADYALDFDASIDCSDLMSFTIDYSVGENEEFVGLGMFLFDNENNPELWRVDYDAVLGLPSGLELPSGSVSDSVQLPIGYRDADNSVSLTMSTGFGYTLHLAVMVIDVDACQEPTTTTEPPPTATATTTTTTQPSITTTTTTTTTTTSTTTTATTTTTQPDFNPSYVAECVNASTWRIRNTGETGLWAFDTPRTNDIPVYGIVFESGQSSGIPVGKKADVEWFDLDTGLSGQVDVVTGPNCAPSPPPPPPPPPPSPKVTSTGRFGSCRYGPNCLIASFSIANFNTAPNRYYCIFSDGRYGPFSFSGTSVNTACYTSERPDWIEVEVNGVRSNRITTGGVLTPVAPHPGTAPPPNPPTPPIRPTPPRSALLRGMVSCATGGKVVGVWVQSSAGGSAFADWAPVAGDPTTARYSILLPNVPTDAQLHVGCGGSRDTWGGNNRTVDITVSGNRQLDVTCFGTSGTGQRCFSEGSGGMIVKQGVNRSDPTAWYVVDGRRYWIPDGGVYQCLQAAGVPGPYYLSNSQLDSLPDQTGRHASCAAGQPSFPDGTSPGLCWRDPSHGTVPTDFFVDACIDSTSVWLRNDTEVPITVMVDGATGVPATVMLDPSPANAVTRAAVPSPWLLLPGDVMRIPMSDYGGRILLDSTEVGGFHALATTVSTFIPVGEPVTAFVTMIGEIDEVYGQYSDCIAGKNAVIQAACRVVLTRDVTFAVGRAVVTGAAKGIVAALLSGYTFSQWADGQVKDIAAYHQGSTALFVNASY